MKEDNKIVFTGPVGVGKTSAIAALSDVPIISTDARASDMTINRKGHTTVAMDYGILNLEGGGKVHLYGTPGQERFDFMWEILTTGGLGLILMLWAALRRPLATHLGSCAVQRQGKAGQSSSPIIPAKAGMIGIGA